MARDMTGNKTAEMDLSTSEVIATISTSTLAQTMKHEDSGVTAPHVYENVTASYNFNTTDSTATALTRLLEGNVTTEVVKETLASTSHLENVTIPQETTSRLISSSSSTFLPVIPVESSSTVENVQTLSPDSLDTTMSHIETTSGYLNGGDFEVQPASTVGIAVGVAIGGFILLAIIVAIVIFFVRRRRIAQKKESEVVMENPRYTLPRDATLPRNFDLTMHTGPMVRNQLNNNSEENLTRTNGKRKKEAPRAPMYQPPGGRRESGSKRKAPSPPNLGGVGYEDLYERDSATGSTEALELQTFLTVDNRNASEPAAADSDLSHSQPLLETFKPDKKSPKRSSKVDTGERPAATEDSIKQDDEDKDEDEQMKTALLGKSKASSNLSLDSYDKSKNPFFGE